MKVKGVVALLLLSWACSGQLNKKYFKLYLPNDTAIFYMVNAMVVNESGNNVWDRGDLPIYYNTTGDDTCHIGANSYINRLSTSKVTAPVGDISSLSGSNDVYVGGNLHKIPILKNLNNSFVGIRSGITTPSSFMCGDPIDADSASGVFNKIGNDSYYWSGAYSSSGNVKYALKDLKNYIDYFTVDPTMFTFGVPIRSESSTLSAIYGAYYGRLFVKAAIWCDSTIKSENSIIFGKSFQGTPDRVILANSSPIAPTSSELSMLPGYDSLAIPANFFNGKRYLYVEIFTTGQNDNIRSFNFESRNTNTSWEVDYNVISTGSYNSYYYFDIFNQNDSIFCIASKKDYSGASGATIAWNNSYDNATAGWIKLIYASGSGVGCVIRRISVYVKNDI